MEDFLKTLVKDAGKKILDKVGSKIKIEYKDEGIYKNYPQLVSNIDIEINRFIINCIKHKFPNHAVHSEEVESINISDGYVWIVDPIDGSTHFSRGIPSFSVSIALMKDEKIILGAVYAPVYDKLFFAKKGFGASENDKPITVSKVKELDKAIIASSVYQSYKIRKLQDTFLALAENVKNLRMFASSALDMCYVASGRIDGRVFANSEIWDHAAAALIVEEAGGKVTDWKSSDWSLKSTSILASNRELHSTLINILNSNIEIFG